MSSTLGLILSLLGLGLIIFAAVFNHLHGSLNIEAKTVGNGQYGTSRWSTKKETDETYQVVPYEPERWRKGKHLPSNISSATIVGFIQQPTGIYARIDTSDSHTLIWSTTGGFKTTGVLYPNLEFTCACGLSFLCTDTKGDGFRDYAGIAQKYYGYTPYVIDLRNPTRSHGSNLLHLVNKYMDLYAEKGKLEYKARAERYAKITAKTIVRMEGFDGGGQNAFFYDAAEGLIASTTLLVSEFCAEGERHIVSVFKILLELLQVKGPAQTKEEKEKKVKPKNEFQKLIELLPDEHKAKWLASAALITSDSSLHSVISTAISRLLSFIDSELEQILCFDSDVDAEQFCNEKVAVFIVFPEEDVTKYFLVSLFVSQLYNECLTIANHGDRNRLDRQVKFYLDEFGTMPKFDSAEQMFTAGKSRNILLYPMIQSESQLYQKYGKEGGEIIIDCCTNVLIGGFSPLSKGAEEVSKALGNQTIQAGSINHSSNGMMTSSDSLNLQMIPSPLMTAERILHMPEGQWILMKTRRYPMLTTMKRYNEWGIKLDVPFRMKENVTRSVKYASEQELFKAVMLCSPKKQSKIDLPPQPMNEDGSDPLTRRHVSNDLLN
jgi:type IV secretion system protein VirD4